MFGHVRGAFTGATADKTGVFEAANGGTVFLDEVGELPSGAQAKLLRALENGEVQRVGSVDLRKVDVRVIAATNRRLDVEIAAGRFRSDLFYRLECRRDHGAPVARTIGRYSVSHRRVRQAILDETSPRRSPG